MSWKQDHANEADKAVNHPLVQDVIEEFVYNIQQDTALMRYGLSKIASYAAQVARAQTLGIDPEMLRTTDEEVAEHFDRLAQLAEDAGTPVIRVVVDAD